MGSVELPDAARSIGRSLRIFKSEVDEMKNDARQERRQARHRAGETVREPPAPATPVYGPRPEDEHHREDNSPRTDNQSGAS